MAVVSVVSVCYTINKYAGKLLVKSRDGTEQAYQAQGPKSSGAQHKDATVIYIYRLLHR